MCYSGGSHPATATRASKMVMMVCLFIFVNVFTFYYIYAVIAEI